MERASCRLHAWDAQWLRPARKLCCAPDACYVDAALLCFLETQAAHACAQGRRALQRRHGRAGRSSPSARPAAVLFGGGDVGDEPDPDAYYEEERFDPDEYDAVSVAPRTAPRRARRAQQATGGREGQHVLSSARAATAEPGSGSVRGEAAEADALDEDRHAAWRDASRVRAPGQAVCFDSAKLLLCPL